MLSDKTIAVLASGGLDSCILVSDLLSRGRVVQPLYIRSQLIWEPAEFHALRRYLDRIRSPALLGLVTLELPLTDLYGNHWSLTGQATPHADDPDEAVYLPGRNALLVIKAAIWCQLHAIPELALAALGTSPFADAKPQFCELMQALLHRDGQPPIRIVLPFFGRDKRQVLELGRQQPLELTFSCLAPVGEVHCGACNKCAERQSAFRALGRTDPTAYAEKK